jgi:uncharacterized phiE125 gp8 family phage protein
MLMEQSQIASQVLPINHFTDHLRVGTGFDDDGVQDGVLETYLRVAIAAVEARIGKVLIERDYRWSVSAWRDFSAQTLPVAPVSAINSVTTIDRLGNEALIDADKYFLETDAHRPRLIASSFVLPSIAIGGTAQIDFTAGYASAWDDIPADLAHAVILLAAHYYEHRHAADTGEGTMPFGVNTLLERYRNIRLFGGRGA